MDLNERSARAVEDPSRYPMLSVPMAAAALGMSRSAAYRAAAAGEIPTVRIGRRIRVQTVAIRRLIGLEA